MSKHITTMENDMTEEDMMRELKHFILIVAVPGIVMAVLVLLVYTIYTLVRLLSCGKCWGCGYKRTPGCLLGSMVVYTLVLIACVGCSIYGLVANGEVSTSLIMFAESATDITNTANKAIAGTTALENLKGDYQIEDIQRAVDDLRADIEGINNQTEDVETKVGNVDDIRFSIMMVAFITIFGLVAVSGVGVLLKSELVYNLYIFVSFFALVFFWLSYAIQNTTTATVDVVCNVTEILTQPDTEDFQELVSMAPAEAQVFINSCVETDSFMTPFEQYFIEVQNLMDQMQIVGQQMVDGLSGYNDDSLRGAIQSTQEIIAIAQDPVWTESPFKDVDATGQNDYDVDYIETVEQLQVYSLKIQEYVQDMMNIIEGIPRIIMSNEQKETYIEYLTVVDDASFDLDILLDVLISITTVLSCSVVKDLTANLVNSLCGPLKSSLAGLTYMCLVIGILLLITPILAQQYFGNLRYEKAHSVEAKGKPYAAGAELTGKKDQEDVELVNAKV